jgi:hypothetical protein
MRLTAIRLALPAVLIFACGTACADPFYVLYGTEIDNDRLFTVNLTTGLATSVGVLAGSQIEGIAFNPDNGTFFGVDNSNTTLIEIDISSDPVIWSLAQTLPYGNYSNIDRNPISGAYYTFHGDKSLYIIDPLTGATTQVGPPTSVAMESLSFDSSGRLFGIGFAPAPSDGILYEIDVLTGAILSSVEITSGLVNPAFDGSLAINPGTGVFYTVATIEGGLYELNPFTGLATRVGSTGLRNVRSLDFAVLEQTPPPAPVPEPATFLLLGTGAAALVASRRRSRSKRGREASPALRVASREW